MITKLRGRWVVTTSRGRRKFDTHEEASAYLDAFENMNSSQEFSKVEIEEDSYDLIEEEEWQSQ